MLELHKWRALNLANPVRTTTKSLRSRILTFVGALILCSLAGSIISIYRISGVNQSLDGINQVSIPMGRLLAQLQADAQLYKREAEHRLGLTHWQDAHWRAKPMPAWLEDVLDGELKRTRELIHKNVEWAASRESLDQWKSWIESATESFTVLKRDAGEIQQSLSRSTETQTNSQYAGWSTRLEEWTRQIDQGALDHEKTLRQAFSAAQTQVSGLRTGLEAILLVVIALSLLLLWLGERALRPLGELTRLARDITRRGLKREDKAKLPELSFSKNDEVSQLGLEFHRMATALLEREKTVEQQRDRLEEQNKMLRDMGALNEDILNSMKSALVVVDLKGRITQLNPVAREWLGPNSPLVIGQSVAQVDWFRKFPGSETWVARIQELGQVSKIEPLHVGGKVYGGRILPLKKDRETHRGAILVIDDLTDEVSLQERLSRAENLAAIGRMSAQVAHEVRNPLHSIGLEAELALELLARGSDPRLKQSMQSILAGVDRLEKITENYLKLSRLSSGSKAAVDLGAVLESVLATYAPNCEALKISVDWSRPKDSSSLWTWGDRDLLEQAVGNLLRNSLQAMEGVIEPKVAFKLERLESGRHCLWIEDNGPGVASELISKLFTPFMTTRAQGTGLGLAFVKKVVEEHGGEVEYVSRSSGASFRIVLPAWQPKSNHAQGELHA